MMDVVYTLANKSKFKDDFELRFSLRSVARQPWVRQVYIIGHCPRWARNVVHIPCPDPYPGNKDANIINKIIRAVCRPQLSDPFIVNSDDQYFLRVLDSPEILEAPPTDFYKYKNYQVKQRANNWHKRVAETIGWCKQNGYPEHIYDSHRPYLVRKSDYIQYMCLAPWGRANGLTTHVYLNICGVTPANIDRTERIKTPDTLKGIKRAIVGAMFLNHNDAGLNPAMKEFLREWFPEPSPWEE